MRPYESWLVYEDGRETTQKTTRKILEIIAADSSISRKKSAKPVKTIRMLQTSLCFR